MYIETERLVIREWKKSDYKDLYEYAKSDLVGPNAGWKSHKSEEESKGVMDRFIKEKEDYAIVLKTENKVIGGCGLHYKLPDESLMDLNQREIGYVLNPTYWGKGYAPEVVDALINYGFNNLFLDLIWCAHFNFNNKSKRVIEKCNFNYRFTRKEKLNLLDNTEVNVVYYNIYKEEYLNNKI